MADRKGKGTKNCEHKSPAQIEKEMMESIFNLIYKCLEVCLNESVFSCLFGNLSRYTLHIGSYIHIFYEQ